MFRETPALNSNAGLCFNGLFVDRDTPPLNKDEKEPLFATLASFFDLRECETKRRGSRREAWLKAMRIGHIRRARSDGADAAAHALIHDRDAVTCTRAAPR